MNYKNLTLIISVLLLFNCSGSKEVAKNTSYAKDEKIEQKPSWVTQRPVNSQFYTGIAVSSKSASPMNYALEAQRNALNELASSIEVDVKSNSMLFTFEEKSKVRDEFKEFIQVKANQNIENYELVASWENAYEYWVYYKLSKEQYKKDKQAKIDKAVNLSVSLIDQANQDWKNENYKLGFTGFFDALQPIKPYLGESLPATINDIKEVYLGNYLLSQISQCSREFHLKSTLEEISTFWGSELSHSELEFFVNSSNNQAIAQIPLRFEYSEGQIRPRDGLTDQKGVSSTEIKKITSKKSIQKVNAEIDFKKMIIGNKRPDEIEKRIFESLKNKKSTIIIDVKSPKIFLKSTEFSLGKNAGSELLNAFSLKAAEMGFLIVSNKKDADLVVDINSATHKAGTAYNLNNVLLIATIEVIFNKTGKLIYHEKLEGVKGVSSSFTDASNQAYKKAIDEINKKIVPRFYRKYIN
ncbi:MAG: LPP20 family lipoprotein [Salibacteraceae bacterium]